MRFWDRVKAVVGDIVSEVVDVPTPDVVRPMLAEHLTRHTGRLD